jgi:uncharacterized protein YjbJ (UPF0337 family)
LASFPSIKEKAFGGDWRSPPNRPLADPAAVAGSRFAGNLGSQDTLVSRASQSGERHMDKDRIKGSAEQAKGKVKEWAGKITGDSKTEAEGKADQVKGKVQNTIGGLKDTVRGE